MSNGSERLPELKSLCQLNVGLLFPFRNPPAWREPFTEFYAEQLAQTRFAEELGYDEIWLTEHHFAEDGYSPAILPIASAIAAMTKRIRIWNVPGPAATA